MPVPQTYKNHTSRDPAFHFFLLPILFANFLLSIYLTVHDWPAHPRSHAWTIVMAFVLLLLLLTLRRYAAMNQDRIIRLEERLRLNSLLPASEHPLLHTLTTRQLIALRFAPDAELPALARRAAAENLTSKQIKQLIVDWRPDHQRI